MKPEVIYQNVKWLHQNLQKKKLLYIAQVGKVSLNHQEECVTKKVSRKHMT